MITINVQSPRYRPGATSDTALLWREAGWLADRAWKSLRRHLAPVGRPGASLALPEDGVLGGKGFRSAAIND